MREILKNSKRVVVVDDHPILRQGMRRYLEEQGGFAVVGEAESATEAVALAEAFQPDAFLLDLSLKGGSNGIEAIKNIKSVSPEAKILVLSMHEEAIYAPRAFRAGALGYISKLEPPEKILAALTRVIEGESYVGDEMKKQLAGSFIARTPLSPVQALTDRELGIFALIGKGITTREIARQLNLSVKTIETHRANIKEKLNVENGRQVVHAAIHWINSQA